MSASNPVLTISAPTPGIPDHLLAGPRSVIHVLIAEDHEENRALLKMLLHANGYRVTVAGNGLEALAAARRDPPDAIVSDVLMPEMDGFALCRAWMQDAGLRAIPFIFYSATYVLPNDENLGVTLGAVRYLIKPLEAEVFLQELRAVLQQWAGRTAPGPTTPIDDTAFDTLHQLALSHKIEDKVAQLEAANLKVQESEARFRSLTEMSSDFYWESDAEHRLTLRFLAGKKSNFVSAFVRGTQIGERRWDIPYLSPDAAGWAAHRAELDAHQPFREFELSRLGTDGNTRFVSISGDPMFDVSAAFKGYRGVGKDITERVRHIDDLQRLRAAMDATVDAIYLVDRTSMRFIYVNDSACRIQGCTRDELLALGPDGVLSTSRTELERIYDSIIAGGPGTEPLELQRQRKDGSQVWVELRRHAQRSGQGWMIVTVVRDITERKEGERVARESAKRFKAIFDQAPIAMALLDRQGHLTISNSPLSQLVGYSNDELSKMTFGDFTYPEDLEKDLTQFTGLIEGKISAYNMEKRYVHKNGGLIWANLFVTMLRDENGLPQDIIGMAEDITERKRAEQELRESERRFSDMLGNVKLVSLMLDREARITYCNEYLLRLTGWRYEEVIGRDWFELFVPREIDYMRDVFPALLANSPDARHRESEILMRSGERRLIRWNSSVLRSGTGDVIGTASIGEDITEQKRAESKIERLNRVYAVLSGINSLIVRVHKRDELFAEACQIAIGSGGFRMAMIAIVEQSSGNIIPAAWAGKDDELQSAITGVLSSGEGAPKTMVAQAIREKSAVVANDSQSDPRVLFGRKYAESGVRSIAVLPLLVGNAALGVLGLYADENGFFDEEEMKLLNELAGDIAFAIDHIDKEERLDYLAYYDALTGLANRTLFLERVAQYIRSAVSGRHKVAVFLIDLQRFKNINDSLGRPAGDALLRQVAEWLGHNVGGASLLARLDADHFAAVMPEVTQAGDVARPLERIMDAFVDHPFHLDDAVFRIAARVGVALFPDDGADADTLFRNAEAALKKAKGSGELYLFYTTQMTTAVAGKVTLENQLRQALDNQEFVLHYQPKVNLASGKVTGAEALIRWNDPRTGLVPPGRFIPILEETGLIYDVGRWALRQALDDYLRWHRAGLPAMPIAVNVSPLQLRNPGFIAEITQAIGVDALAPAGLEIEITESVIMEDVKHNIASLQAIRAMGVRIAIDDFGTGFSSLAYLAKLPVDTLKIDRSFVIGMTAGPEGLALVSSVISLAHALKLKVVAEGVETEVQSRLLRLLSCDEMQGFLFSKPVSKEIFERQFLVSPAAV
ncbi:MAG: GGDEF/EAL domain-containing response regulator [Burkholderiales bacterium]